MDDIFPADIHYMLYINYIIRRADEHNKPVVLFNNGLFTALSNRIFAYLDGIEEVSETDFYESYLVPPDDYIDFKKTLNWFTFNSYLTGIEFSQKVEDYLFRESKEEKDPEQISYLLYAEQDRLMCEEPSSLTAFFPVDILAGAMHCDDEKKVIVANLKWRPFGVFHAGNETATHFHFTHTATQEGFNVAKQSFNKPLKVEEQCDQWIAKLALWNNGEAWISGTCIGYPLAPKKLKETNIKEQRIFQKHFKPYRQKINDGPQPIGIMPLLFFNPKMKYGMPYYGCWMTV